MKKRVLCIVMLMSGVLFSQNIKPEYGQLINQYNQAYDNRSFRGMKTNAEKLIEHYPDDYAGYALYGYFLICRGQNNRAAPYFDTMKYLNPLDNATNSLLSLYHFLMKDMQGAEYYLQRAFITATEQHPETGIIEDAEVVSEMAYRNDLNAYIDLVNDTAKNYTTTKAAQNYFACIQQMMQGKPCDDIYNAIAELKTQTPNLKILEPLSLYAKGASYYINLNDAKAKSTLDQFLENSKNLEDLAYYRASAYFFKSEIYAAGYNYQSALLNINKALAELDNIPLDIGFNLLLTFKKMMRHSDLNQPQQNLQASYDLLNLAKSMDNKTYQVQALNNIGSHYLNSALPNERQKAAEHLIKALYMAKKNGYTHLENKVRGNYTLVLWQQGRRQEAKENSDVLFKNFVEQGQYADAEVTANNLGFMFYIDGDYQNAANYFKKAVDMLESKRESLSPQERMRLLNSKNSSYAGLVMSYEKLNQPGPLFEIQDRNRSGYLKDRLDADMPNASLADAQQLLGSDDLLLYYSLTGPGEIVINAITQNSAKVYYNYPIDGWLTIKKNWIDRTKKIPSSYNGFLKDFKNDIVDGNLVQYTDKRQNFKAEDFQENVEFTRQLLQTDDPKLKAIRQALLKHWYKFTLQPIEHLLNQKKNLIIAPSNELNYLPFEAFINTQGQYVIKENNVKYIPSVSVWKRIAQRQYAPNRKPLLAMGGAKYQPSENVKGTARSMQDFYAITEEISTKIANNNFNFKDELQKMGLGGANYLPGTLREVQAVGQLDDKVDVFTGQQMKESVLKNMDKNGELANYKAIMLSSHGFSLDVVPALSGVMMTQPDDGDDGEDTFLLAPEIARLHLKADLAVLSACDTGLGKLVGGEGINGLNSAFLVAGANATLLSLWPVNDASTAITMENVFKLIIKDNYAPNQAVNAVKRAMATGQAGEKLTHPKYWAPFLYNGI